jgi:hypothetical protein
MVDDDRISLFPECGVMITLLWAGRQQRRRGSWKHWAMVYGLL